MSKVYMKSDHIKFTYQIEVLKKRHDTWEGKAVGKKTYLNTGNLFTESFDIGSFNGFSEKQVRDELIKLIETQKGFDAQEMRNLAESYTETIE